MKESDVALLYARAGFEPPASLTGAPSANKYNARKKEIDGHLFDSSGEAEAYKILKQWELAGAISNLELQPVYVLQPKLRREGKTHRAIKYVADFRFHRAGRTVVVDFKGQILPVFAIKLKMFYDKYPDLLFELWNRETLRNNK